MTCSGCGAREPADGARYCARCLLLAAGQDDDSPFSSGADESPPCDLLSIMGETARAMTFLGEQTWPVRRLVAFKVFKDERFCRLRPAAPAVPPHPNIAAVLESGRLGGRPYVMTGYFAGGPVTSCYDRHRLDAGARMAALLAVADALAFAHAHGTGHGRITVSNVLCEPRPPFAVHVVDFPCGHPAGEGEPGVEARIRADLDGLVQLADLLLRSPFALIAGGFDLPGHMQRLRLSARSAVDVRTALAELAAAIPLP